MSRDSCRNIGVGLLASIKNKQMSKTFALFLTNKHQQLVAIHIYNSQMAKQNQQKEKKMQNNKQNIKIEKKNERKKKKK